jgi:hypothetical protein
MSFQKQLDGADLEQVRLLELAIRRAARTGAIRSVRSCPVAFAVFDITWGLITQRLRGWSETIIDQDISFAVDLLWKGMTER